MTSAIDNMHEKLVGSDSDSLLSSAAHRQVDNFIKVSTANFDSSHNWQHADIVYQNTMVIAKALEVCYEDDILSLAAKLHDVCDHKYPESIPRSSLVSFINSIVGEAKCARIMLIIDNVSFSKQDKGLAMDLPHPDSQYLDWIRDADRLEAIGQIGIDRCKSFTAAKYPNASSAEIRDDVVKHCHEKLLRLYTEPGFIVTEPGRRMAKPLHQVILDYVNQS